MKFKKAKTVLRDAAYKIGGELFTHDAITKIAKMQAEMGDEEAKKELDTAAFVSALFNIEKTIDEKHAEFVELICAIDVLSKYNAKKGGDKTKPTKPTKPPT